MRRIHRGSWRSRWHLDPRQQRKAERQAGHLFQTLLRQAFRGEL